MNNAIKKTTGTAAQNRETTVRFDRPHIKLADVEALAEADSDTRPLGSMAEEREIAREFVAGSMTGSSAQLNDLSGASDVGEERKVGTQPRRRKNPSDISVKSITEREPHSSEEQVAALQVASPNVLQANQLVKVYRKGRHEVQVLKGCDFAAEAGKITAILGQSGSGKSTLLHLLGTLDVPDQGEIYFEGKRIDNLSRKKRDRFRNSSLGMIFQFYHLLPEITAFQNVLMPMMIQQGFFGYLKNKNVIRERAKELLCRVGLEHRLHHKPRELSGGEMQRAAIARALVSEPELLLADEPTGNLDGETGAQIIELLNELNRENGLTIVMVTHDEEIASSCDAVIQLVNGQIKS